MARKNYFDYQKQKFGENFLQKKNAWNLQFDALRIFSDLIRGNIDVRKYEKYFSDTQLLESCLLVSSQKQSFHAVSYSGVEMLLQSMQNNNQPIDDIVFAVLDFHQKSAEAYGIIYNAFLGYKNTMNIEYLIPINSQLRNYRDYV